MLIGRLKPSTMDTAACELGSSGEWIQDGRCDAVRHGASTPCGECHWHWIPYTDSHGALSKGCGMWASERGQWAVGIGPRVGGGTRLTIVVVNAASSEVELGELGRVSSHQGRSIGEMQCICFRSGRLALTVLPSSPQSEPELHREISAPRLDSPTSYYNTRQRARSRRLTTRCCRCCRRRLCILSRRSRSLSSPRGARWSLRRISQHTAGYRRTAHNMIV